jgi:hypothetical protein
MSDWLLIITVTSHLYGGETAVTNVTMHHFHSREMCESAAKQAIKLVNATKAHATVKYQCLRQDYGDWVEGKEK